MSKERQWSDEDVRALYVQELRGAPKGSSDGRLPTLDDTDRRQAAQFRTGLLYKKPRKVRRA